jgi:hypothetical protein
MSMSAACNPLQRQRSAKWEIGRFEPGNRQFFKGAARTISVRLDVKDMHLVRHVAGSKGQLWPFLNPWFSP